MSNPQKIYVPPIKIQGKKTKLVPFIRENLPESFERWVEPFMGSGVVGFNVQPKKAVFADNNPHIINFYNDIKAKKITAPIAKEFLQTEGKLLAEKGVEHFLAVRERFNRDHAPLDFLFLNRSCFNGMIRFNKSFGFNVPYGHKPQRFAQAYVTKIVNQIKQVSFFIENNDWEFVCQDFKETLADAQAGDLIYCDPPYIGRHVDYFDSWSEENEYELESLMNNSKAQFIVSTWFANKYRANQYLAQVWKNYNVVTTEHFYHFGGKEENRNAVTEALILNYSPPNAAVAIKITKQMSLFAEV
ncbi:MAG: DNA adenine methylase [Pyrinomonadaceae bacterium]